MSRSEPALPFMPCPCACLCACVQKGDACHGPAFETQIGKSLYDEEGAKIVQTIMAKAKERNVTIHLPVDYVTGSKFGEDAEVGAADDASGIPDTWLGLDIGPKSIAAFREVVLASKTILWNGYGSCSCTHTRVSDA